MRMARRDPPQDDGNRLGQRIALEALRQPQTLQALTLWNAQRGERRFPPREALSPRAMAPFLRNTVLVRVIDGGKDYQFRVVGDAIVEVQGASLQGLTIGEIDKAQPGYGSALRPVYDRVVARGEPLAFRGQVPQAALRRAFFHESLVLPLGADGTTVDHLLVVGAYSYTMDTPS